MKTQQEQIFSKCLMNIPIFQPIPLRLSQKKVFWKNAVQVVYKKDKKFWVYGKRFPKNAQQLINEVGE